MKLIKPTLKDIHLMQELVKPEVENGIILHRSDDEIATNIRSYTLAYEDKLLGFGALHFHASDLAEIRSLVVGEFARGKGVGQEIVKKLLLEAGLFGIKRVFTLTYQTIFFEKLGFKIIKKENLPSHKIWADCIKCKHFPVCDEVALVKEI